MKIKGIHHITAIAGNAQRNYDFYTKVLGLRLVKKTVNFDDPGTYHFYYGNEVGEPGTILTFFPWEGIVPGRIGTGMATEIGYSVPKGAIQFWKKRLQENKVKIDLEGSRFGESYVSFSDPDGLKLDLIETNASDERKPWTTNEVGEDVAIRGFHSVTLTLKNMKRTSEILKDVFGYVMIAEDRNRFRFITDAVPAASIVDIIEEPLTMIGHVAGGTNHHVAFRVENEDVLMKFRERILERGMSITEKIDRNYFYSLYFKEPGGVLFEIATDNPGFAIDEDVKELGTNLKLPVQYEQSRKNIETALPLIR
ncbi:MAG TPA: ring-cleaving dioxygenase [Chitinophagaceae bacterium]|nr:ring-cleaving dioxygenase [Chitinophagaceae bacterium]